MLNFDLSILTLFTGLLGGVDKNKPTGCLLSFLVDYRAEIVHRFVFKLLLVPSGREAAEKGQATTKTAIGNQISGRTSTIKLLFFRVQRAPFPSQKPTEQFWGASPPPFPVAFSTGRGRLDPPHHRFPGPWVCFFDFLDSVVNRYRSHCFVYMWLTFWKVLHTEIIVWPWTP